MKVKTHILCHVDKSVLWVDKDEANKASMKTQAEMGDRHRPNSVPNSIFFFFFLKLSSILALLLDWLF